MFSLRRLTLLAATLPWATTLAAQHPRLAVVPRAGQTVRVSGQDRWPGFTGRIVSIGPDSMTLARGRDTVLMPSRLLRDGRVRTGSRPAASKGALAGGAAGLVLGLVASSSEECHNCWFDISPIGYAVGGIALGAGAGMLVGSLFREPIWSRAGAPAASSGPFNGALGAGDVVRLLGPDRTLNGIVTGGMGDTAIVRLETGSDTAVALGSLERYIGERLSRGRSMAYGAATGALFGVGLYIGASRDDYAAPVSAAQAVGRTALLTALGGGIGYLIGNKTRPAWTPVAPTQARSFAITPYLGPARVGMVARLEF